MVQVWIDATQTEEVLTLNHALDVLGLLDTADRHAIANELLSRGCDYQSLIELHIQPEATNEESRTLFEQAARSAGVAASSPSNAATKLIFHVMDSLLAGRYTPSHGLAVLYEVLVRAPDADGDYAWSGYDCAAFAGLYWTYVDDLGLRPCIDRAPFQEDEAPTQELGSIVIKEASNWLARNPNAILGQDNAAL
jgi:hypothetical protein